MLMTLPFLHAVLENSMMKSMIYTISKVEPILLILLVINILETDGYYIYSYNTYIKRSLNKVESIVSPLYLCQIPLAIRDHPETDTLKPLSLKALTIYQSLIRLAVW